MTTPHLRSRPTSADEQLPWDRVRVSVVVPAYNERATAERVLRRLREVPLQVQVIVVDDGSRDGTRDLLGRLEHEGLIDTLVLHEVNRGKGAALRTGFQHATGHVVVVQDADLEYDPLQLPTLLEPILSGKADAVYGSRFLGGPHRVLFFWHSVGNRFLTLLSNMFTDVNLTDMETCYKMIRTDLLRTLPLTADRFGFEPEVTARLAQAGARIYELPISYHGRSYAEGKKIGWRDGVSALNRKPQASSPCRPAFIVHLPGTPPAAPPAGRRRRARSSRPGCARSAWAAPRPSPPALRRLPARRRS